MSPTSCQSRTAYHADAGHPLLTIITTSFIDSKQVIARLDRN
jgi:hypothetical protein